ncbi:uncharacterized protein LOC107304399 isoform X1 [Oryza brachyantha]|uniref:uncharacterized protein LOC107304399 isoform X1 n=2 Tax=Oryza brachyantha TaxID=4533 RepID=UPI001ADBFFF4|nr:uncharacterized protein LOC107304399 isoform X1 [Oryza brachyantha]
MLPPLRRHPLTQLPSLLASPGATAERRRTPASARSPGRRRNRRPMLRFAPASNDVAGAPNIPLCKSLRLHSILQEFLSQTCMNSAVSFSLFQNSELSCSTELVVNSAISYSLFQNSELDLMEYICMQIAEFTLGDCYEVSRNNQRPNCRIGALPSPVQIMIIASSSDPRSELQEKRNC